MKDNKLKLLETRVVTVVTAFETLSFGLSYAQIPTTTRNVIFVIAMQFSPNFFFSALLPVFVNKSSQKQKTITLALQSMCQADNCV